MEHPSTLIHSQGETPSQIQVQCPSKRPQALYAQSARGDSLLVTLATPDDLRDILPLDRAVSPVFAKVEAYLKLRDTGMLLLARCGDAGANAEVEAHDTGALCGFAAWSIAPDDATLVNLAVAPAHRRQGIAQVLLQASFGALYRTQLERAVLELRSSNMAARSLYDSMGFTVDGCRRAYYPSAVKGSQGEAVREDAILMSRDFSAADAASESLEIQHAGA